MHKREREPRRQHDGATSSSCDDKTAKAVFGSATLNSTTAVFPTASSTMTVPRTTPAATVAATATTSAPSTTTTTTTTVSYNVMDVANLPLLIPFQIRNPNESVLVKAIFNEQHASDALAAAMKVEETLRAELQKASSSSLDDKDENNAGKKGTAPGGGKKKIKSVRTIALMKAIENDIAKQLRIIGQYQQDLENATQYTCVLLQTEYTKNAVCLDPESRQYAILDEAYTFLYARTTTPSSLANAEISQMMNNGSSTNPQEHHSYVEQLSSVATHYHEQRLAYVREMLPIMKKVMGGIIMVGNSVAVEARRNSIAALPYVHKFQSEQVLVDAISDEMYQLAITQALRARFGDTKKNRDNLDTGAKNKVLRLAEDMLMARENETSELVRKWYRRRSVKIHPDRNGEQMRPAFEEFTDARNLLADCKLRQNYLQNMLDLTQYYQTTQLLSPAGIADKLLAAHNQWNTRNRPDKVDKQEGVNSKKKGDASGKKEKTLQLEGGLHQQMPKGVIIYIKYQQRQHVRANNNIPTHANCGIPNTTATVASISIHALSPLHEFYARVRNVFVELRSTDNEKHTFHLCREEIVKTIRTDRHGPILASEIHIIEKSLNPGNWDVYWYAELDTVGTDPLNVQNATKSECVVTRHSAVRSFEIQDYHRESLLQSFDQAENNCKIVKAELFNMMQKLRTNQIENVANSKERYGLYHQTLVRARKRYNTMIEIMTRLGKNSTACDELSLLLAQSRQVFSELEEVVDANNKRQEKKVDVKRFKSYIASILEGDDPIAWMKNVTSTELCNEGGDVNRLYQLFIEGKGQLALMFDSEVFKEASMRQDLFSTKQRKDLAAKGDEAATAEAKEEEDAIAAEVKRIADEAIREKLRREGELRDKWSMVGHNATIHGLTSEKGKYLNNQLAKILYFLVDKDRFEVGLYKSEKKALLKRDNLAIYYGHMPSLTPKHRSAVEVTKQTHPLMSAPKVNPVTLIEKDATGSTACSLSTGPNSKVSTVKESAVDRKVETAMPHPDQKLTPSAPTGDNFYDAKKTKTTIYVRSAQSKKLTGKRGRKKGELVKKSGVADIHIETYAIGTQVPVHLFGSHEATLKAIDLIQDEVGVENVSKNMDTKTSAVPVTPPRTLVSSFPIVATMPAPTTVPDPTPSVPLPSSLAHVPAMSTLEPPGLVKKKSTPISNSYQTSTTSLSSSSLFANSFANCGAHHVPTYRSDSEPASHFSFDDALLPCGLMDTSMSSPTKSLPREVPSEIGIRSQLTRETMTITEDGDRSSASNTTSNSTLNENDPLLMFLRSQHLCIKGNIEEFYTWLVNEDIDCMSALKEAVSDDEYLDDSMKVGCGSSGIKGFKRKAFQRAVMEFKEVNNTQAAGPMRGMNGNLLHPANLFSDFDTGH